MSLPGLLVATRVLPLHSMGGMQIVAWDLARALSDRGHPVTVLTTRIPGHPPRFDVDSLEVVALPDASPRRYSRAWWRESRLWLSRNHGQVRAVLSVSAAGYGMLALRDRLPGVRFVLQAHGTSLGEIQAKWRTRKPELWVRSVKNVAWLGRDVRAYAAFDRIVAVGPSVEKQFRQWPLRLFLPAELLCTIENGVDTELFRPDREAGRRARVSLGLDPGDRVVVSVSRLHRQKGILEALEGVASWMRKRRPADRAVRYLVVSDRPERARAEAVAERALPAGRVRFLGEVQRERIPELLNAADAFLFTTRHVEGLPLNALEAASTGLPLVLSSSLRASLELPRTARYVDPARPDEIGNALSAVAEEFVWDGPRDGGLPDRYTLRRSAERYAAALFPPTMT